MEKEEKLSAATLSNRWIRILVLCTVFVAMWLTPAAAHQNGTDGTAPYTVEHASIQDSFYPPSVWNDWYIYLSPAHHWQGWKFGCNNYTEDLNMPLAAVEAAVGAGTDLAARGYYVRVGRADPDENVTRSNSWGSGYSKRRHIAMHSNAVSNNACGNGGGAGDGNKGTEVYYVSTTGSNLALNLWNSLKASSPGTEDSQASDVRSNSLYELTATVMPAAYIEAEFHDWPSGVTWLVDYDVWAWRVGWGVDQHLGYP